MRMFQWIANGTFLVALATGLLYVEDRFTRPQSAVDKEMESPNDDPVEVTIVPAPVDLGGVPLEEATGGGLAVGDGPLPDIERGLTIERFDHRTLERLRAEGCRWGFVIEGTEPRYFVEGRGGLVPVTGADWQAGRGGAKGLAMYWARVPDDLLVRERATLHRLRTNLPRSDRGRVQVRLNLSRSVYAKLVSAVGAQEEATSAFRFDPDTGRFVSH